MNVSPESFPNAPTDWDIETAKATAQAEGITLSNDHWELIRALQEYYTKVEFPHLRQIKDALDEKFHSRGGMKYLYEIMPGGPVAAGCRLAGLEVPAGAIDKSFGSTA
ncbi:MAG: TusE/DsrC/DsvC family sulfur relay protein [Gammaproteobacteria bacterium]|jgi:tRNA 2-thiouridine synthesizing protein E|nr:TusE/DsrC/DsvC family sulfur relay protein [Gammaproteobacteria bacterium]